MLKFLSRPQQLPWNLLVQNTQRQTKYVPNLVQRNNVHQNPKRVGVEPKYFIQAPNFVNVQPKSSNQKVFLQVQTKCFHQSPLSYVKDGTLTTCNVSMSKFDPLNHLPYRKLEQTSLSFVSASSTPSHSQRRSFILTWITQTSKR
uniref:Uncharacterized protein n=1 Tax=Cacopsylla melanoneura TaxID=428564 RepID=A0A8D9B5Z4_9HEMI